MNTEIRYRYCDGDNHKVSNECIVAGEITEEQLNNIIECCDEGRYFIPKCVGLPAKYFDNYCMAADHPWMELRKEWFELVDSKPTVSLTVDELERNFFRCDDFWTD